MKAIQYITGITALNIPLPNRSLPDWHTCGLTNVKTWHGMAWQIASVNVRSTEFLIGHEDLYDATAVLRRYAPKTPGGTLAATYERAVFDFLYHQISQGKPVPSYQAKDIDEGVDF